MTISSVSLPRVLEEEVVSLIKAGLYSSKSGVFEDAIRHLFSCKKDLKTVIAVEMYKEGKISLGRAAEIAEVSTEKFKEILADRNIKRIIEVKR